ncbi:hypothetical protein DY000_02040045 [Brassica cretica]|uniref:Uncharacterized protein n=1 Tax=Brassica cretica TaxID=69181 RepID=A0ABQ7BPR8_BRACR|nr:hypothetical protein DY000_02040045 [Brassica cretica]
MDPNHARSDCIESINLDISRSGKPKPSKIDHDAKGQSIPLQRRGHLSSDKQSDTSRQATNKSDVAPSEEIMREVETINFHEHEVAKLDMPHDDALVITLELAGTILSKILVDSGSAVNVASQKTLRSISQPTPLIDHEPTPLNSFEGKTRRTAASATIPEEADHETDSEAHEAFRKELEARPDWRLPIFNYIKNGSRP